MLYCEYVETITYIIEGLQQLQDLNYIMTN